MNQSDVVTYLRNTPLIELGPELGALMENIREHRAVSNGFVPREVLPFVLGISGQYTCLEFAVSVADPVHGERFLMRPRGDAEQGWFGQLHIPGVTIANLLDSDMMQDAIDRMEKELPFIPWSEYRARLIPAGIEAHDEPERNCTCLTLVMTLALSLDEFAVLNAPAEWVLVSPGAPPESTIDHHRGTLRWLSSPSRLPFELVDLRRAV